MARATSAIPVGSQFTPKLLNLDEFLKACVLHSGDKAELRTAVWAAPLRVTPVASPTAKRANLPLDGAVHYGLLERETWEATQLCTELSGLDAEDLWDAFAAGRLAGTRAQQAFVAELNLMRRIVASGLPAQS